MKKIIAILLCMAMSFIIVACGKVQDTGNNLETGSQGGSSTGTSTNNTDIQDKNTGDENSEDTQEFQRIRGSKSVGIWIINENMELSNEQKEMFFNAVGNKTDDIIPIFVAAKKLEKEKNQMRYAFLCSYYIYPDDWIDSEHVGSKPDNMGIGVLFISNINETYYFNNLVPLEIDSVEELNVKELDFDALLEKSMVNNTKNNENKWVLVSNPDAISQLIGFTYDIENKGEFQMSFKIYDDKTAILKLEFDEFVIEKTNRKENLEDENEYGDAVIKNINNINVAIYENDGKYTYATWEQDGYYYALFGDLNKYEKTVAKFFETND